MCELVEGCSQDDEQCRRHDESVSIHRQVMMDAVQKEMQGQSDGMVGQVVIEVK